LYENIRELGETHIEIGLFEEQSLLTVPSNKKNEVWLELIDIDALEPELPPEKNKLMV
jgi:hypothetical protein